MKIVSYIVYDAPYWQIYLLVVLYFLFLYFMLGWLFQWFCQRMEKRNWLHKITEREPDSSQMNYEKRYSFVSILIFGLSGVAAVLFIRNGIAHTRPDCFPTIVAGLLILTLWNEVHFYIIHRIMHARFMMKRAHYIHHSSVISNVYSVFSFHPWEAFLLGTVQLCIMPFIAFAPLALALFPLVSILLNFAGHAGYRLGDGNGKGWYNFASRHNAHHHKFRPSYGFALPIFDKLFNRLFTKK